MISKQHIKKMLDMGVISPDQYRQILTKEEVAKPKSYELSGIIIALFTVGMLFILIGVILVVGSWREIPAPFKVILLLISNFAIFYLGYWLKYQQQSSPKIGGTLVFLGALLFGFNIFMVADMYKIPVWTAHFDYGEIINHWLIIIWLAGVMPLIYLLNSRSLAVLGGLLVLFWFNMISGEYSLLNANSRESLILEWVSFSVLLMGVGALHQIKPRLSGIAMAYKFVGLITALFILFALTFRSIINNYPLVDDYKTITFQTFLLPIITFILLLINCVVSYRRSNLSGLESIMIIGVFLLTLLTIFDFNQTILFTYYNVLFALIIMLFIILGHKAENSQLVSMGALCLMIFVFVKGLSELWGINRSLFFISGGILLVVIGIIIERNLRKKHTNTLKVEKNNE